MATKIESSGLFRDGYRIKIGEGSQEVDATKRTQNLNETSLSDLIDRAKRKWPGAQFELRVIEKRNGTYLEVLKQKASTLAKDAKPKYSYEGKAETAPLHERDKRRLEAARLMAEKGLLQGDGRRLYFARDPEGGEKHFARDAARGVHARKLFDSVASRLDKHWEEKLAQLQQDSAPPPPPPELPIVPQDPILIERQEQEEDLNPFANFDPLAGENPVDNARSEKLKGMAESLKSAAEQGGNNLKKWAEGARVPDDLSTARKVALSGRRGESALRVDRQIDGERKTRYYDWGSLKRFNKGPAFAPPPVNDSTQSALAAASLSAMSELRGALQTAERNVRTANAATPDKCWTSSSLKDALLKGAEPTLAKRAKQQANIEDGILLPGQNANLSKARTAAQTLLAQLIVLEHLGAVTYDPESLSEVVKQHETQSQALLEHMRAHCTPEQVRAFEQHLTDCRNAFVARAEQGNLDKFPSAAAERRLGKLESQIAAARERLKDMPSKEEYQSAIDNARLLIETRAVQRQERSQALGADANARKALERLRNVTHKAEVPPKNLSTHPDWKVLCDFVEVVNNLRSAGREGFEGYGPGERVPDEVVASRFKVNQFYEPFAATKILSEVRKLMESEEGSGAQRPIRVYIPSGRAGVPGEWRTWSRSSDSGPMSDQALRVKVAQMLELEFLIAHNPSVDKSAVEQLQSMHQRFADELLVAQGDRAEQSDTALRNWVQGSKDRVAKLVDDFKKEQRKPDREFFETLRRANELREDAKDLLRLNQANERARRLRAGQENVSQAELEVAFPPHSADEAIDWIFNAEEHYTKRAAANDYLMRQFTSSDLDAASREDIAGKLAARLMEAGPDVKIPAALRMLAAASRAPSAEGVREAVSQEVRKAMLAQGILLDTTELNRPATLLDYGRLVYREEIKAQLEDAIDDRRLALVDLVRPGDTQVDTAKAEEMGERFREAAQAHFEKPGETRPFASVFLVNNNHWVSLIATKNAQGEVSCIATDTNAAEPPDWFTEIKKGLSVPPLDNKLSIPVTFAGASLQEGRASNACGVLQSSLLQSLQRRDASVDAQAHVREWIKTGGLSPDDGQARWQVLGERAQMMQSTVEKGLPIAEADALTAERALKLLDDIASYQFQHLDQHLASGGSPNDPAYAERLQIITESLSNVRRIIGQLKLFDAKGDLEGAPNSMQLDQIDVLLQLYRLQAGQQNAGGALSSLQTAYANVVRRGDPDERKILESLIAELKRQEGIELLSPEQLDKERAALNEKITQAQTLNNREALDKLADDLLPGWSEYPQELGSPWRDYLARFPQRGPALAFLARATERLSTSEGASAEGLGYQHEAFVIWSALADSPAADLDSTLRADAAAGCERTMPSAEIPADIANEFDNAVDYSPEEAARLRRDLDQSLNEYYQKMGYSDRIRPIENEDMPIVEDGLAEQEIDELRAERRRDKVIISPANETSETREVEAARLAFEKACLTTTEPDKAPPQGGVQQWAKRRDAELCRSLFGDAGSKKFFSTGGTLGSYKTLPPLQMRADDLETIYRVGELMAIQMARKDKSERARGVFDTYLEPLKSYGKNQAQTPAAKALGAIETFYENNAQRQPEPEEPFEIPKIRRGADKDTFLISSKRN